MLRKVFFFRGKQLAARAATEIPISKRDKQRCFPVSQIALSLVFSKLALRRFLTGHFELSGPSQRRISCASHLEFAFVSVAETRTNLSVFLSQCFYRSKTYVHMYNTSSSAFLEIFIAITIAH